MALSLLNYFVWEIEEARAAFMIADAIVLTSLHYIDRGMKAEQKLREIEAAKEAKKHEMDKAASRAQNGATRQQQKSNKNSNPSNGGKKHFNIHQPKRD